MECTQAMETLLSDDCQALMDVFTSTMTEAMQLFYPSSNGTLIYQNTGAEVMLCYLLHNLDEKVQKSKLMNYNRPQPDILFVPNRSEDHESTVEEEQGLMSSLKQAPYPVILDSHITGAHHRIWKGHGGQENVDNTLDIKCRDPYGVFPILSQQVPIPDETMTTFQIRSTKGIFSNDIVSKVLSSKCFTLILSTATSSNSDKHFNFYEAEMIIFRALPVALRQAYVIVYIASCFHLHYEFPELNKVLLHALFWTYDELITTPNEQFTPQYVAGKLVTFVSQKEVKNYFMPSQTIENMSQDDQQEDSVVLKQEFRKAEKQLLNQNGLSFAVIFDIPDDESEMTGDFRRFMQDRITCAVKLNVLRLRKQLCDAGTAIHGLSDWLECNSNAEERYLLSNIIKSWLVSMQYVNKSKKPVDICDGDPKLSLSTSSWKIAEASLAYRRKEYKKAFDLVAPILSAVSLYVSEGNCNTENTDDDHAATKWRPLTFLADLADDNLADLAATSMTDPSFLHNSLVLQALSVFIISDCEVRVHADFFTDEEVRLAASPLAGELVNNSTGIFSLPVVGACIGAMSLWQMADKSPQETERLDPINEAVQILAWAEQLVADLAAEPWDANEKRFCAHQNLLGRCYLQMGRLQQAETAFTRSSHAFPRPWSAASTLRKRAQKERERQEAGNSHRTWVLAAGLCGAVAIGVGLLRGYAK